MYNLIVVSDYDGGYCFTIAIDGQKVCVAIDGKILLECENLEIGRMYQSQKLKDFVSWCMEKYKRPVLICADGDIEYFDYIKPEGNL